MIREVLKFPDPRLREKGVEIKSFGPEVKKLAEDMLETMYDERGIGLAAPQIGEIVQMIVIDCRAKDEKGNIVEEEMTELEVAVKQPLVIINPKILDKKGKTTYDEGCLSVPGFYETVERFDWIKLEYQDINGKTHTLETDGLLSICIQHEMDHLEGTLFIDRLSFVKSNKIKNSIKKNGYQDRKREDKKAEELEKTPVRR